MACAGTKKKLKTLLKTMNRTVKRYSHKINNTKWNHLTRIARLFRDEKNCHLLYYNITQNYVTDKSHIDQQMRNVKSKYVSPNNLQARQWKIVQKSAYQTVDKNWCALAVYLKPMIAQHKNKWTEVEIHYAYWLTYSGKRLAELVDGNAPKPEHFKVSYKEQKRVRNYLRRVIRRKGNARPIAKMSRSVELDSDMYSLKDYGKTQYIEIMSLENGKRIRVPLTGHSKFGGNIKIILDFAKHRVEVHTNNDFVLEEIPVEINVVPLDAGVSEVFTDKNGIAFEATFGKTIKKVSDKLNKTMKARNKSHALRKKSSKSKAKRIKKFNLGKIKLNKRKLKAQKRIQQQISQAISQVVKTQKPTTIVTERLDIRGKSKSKGMSRLVSYWMRGSLKERLSYLALVKGFHHEQVNPAYTSQMCPTCGFIDKKNRAGDTFQCLNCGHRDHADRVAAINLGARFFDNEIKVYTPKTVVRSILQARFSASLQNPCILKPSSGISVSGRTCADGSPHKSETPVPK